MDSTDTPTTTPLASPQMLAAAQTWVEAGQEADRLSGTVPGIAFYRDKVDALWERALESEAYADLGDYSWDAFCALEPTSKDSLKQDPWDFTTVGIDESVKYYETTGTTGKVTPTPRLSEDIAWNVSSVAAAWQDVISTDDRVLVLLPSDVVPVADLIVNVCELLGVPHTRAYPYAVGITGWDRVLGLWETLRPTAVFAAPGEMLELTRLLKNRKQFAPFAESLNTLMLLGEVSTQAMRQRLATWWGATVLDASYGSTETGTLAATCAGGRLHLLTGANFFEIVAGDRSWPVHAAGEGNAADGLEGRLVVTPLNAYARPLLRFDTGDQVVLSHRCGCALDTPVLLVNGRASDQIEVGGHPVSVRGVEDVVYGSCAATGYLLEVDETTGAGRLLLERDPEADQDTEDGLIEAVQDASAASLGFRWSSVVWVNSLPSSTKSGASQKNWKRSHVRLVHS